MEQFAGFLLALFVGVWLLNVAQGHGAAWLRAKFLGDPT